MTKQAVLERINPGKDKDTEGASFSDLTQEVDKERADAGLASEADADERGWAESACLAIKKWWHKKSEASEQLSFQIKSFIWGNTKKGVNGYMAAWLDYAGKHPLPDDGSMAPPADVVPDVAPAHAYPDQAYPDGCDGPGEQVVYTGWRWVYNMLRAQVANYGTNDTDGVWERRNALGSQRVKILQRTFVD